MKTTATSELLELARQILRTGLTVAVPAMAATAVSASPVTTNTTVSYLLNGITLSVTSMSPTTLNLELGEAYTLSGSWTVNGQDPNCPNCVYQAYLASLPGLDEQINLAPNVNARYGYTYFGRGSYSQSFTAPAVAGTCYFGAAALANFNYVPVHGAANSLNQVSYILNVGMPDTPTAVPEPASLALTGTALPAATAFTRRRVVTVTRTASSR